MSNPLIEYGRPEPRRRAIVPGWLAALLIVGATLALIMVAFFPVWRHPRGERADRVKCASNFGQISRAIDLYSQKNNESYPPDFQTILYTQPVSPDVFICWRTDDTKATPNTALSKPGHCSYVYVGAALRTTCSPDCVVAFEDPANHNFEGANFLYADGHVDWMDMRTTMFILNELNAARNPPRFSGVPLGSVRDARKDYEKNWKARMARLKSNPWVIPATRPVTRPSWIR